MSKENNKSSKQGILGKIEKECIGPVQRNGNDQDAWSPFVFGLSKSQRRLAERVDREDGGKRKTSGKAVGDVGDDPGGVSWPESIFESVRACFWRRSARSTSISGPVGVEGITTSVPFNGGVS